MLLAVVVLSTIPIAAGLSTALGYVGPSCAVVDDLLYLHGIYTRRLLRDELVTFYKYQNDINMIRHLREAIAKGASFMQGANASLPAAPTVPDFCQELDDSVEMVLNGCVVRNERVYIDERLIRPLNGLERNKVNAVLSANRPSWLASRARREAKHSEETAKSKLNATTIPLAQPESNETHHDVANVLGHFLNINASVAERFLPIARMSPILQHLNEKIADAASRAEIFTQVQHDAPVAPNSATNPMMQPSSVQQNVHHVVMHPQHNSPSETSTEIPHLIIGDNGQYSRGSPQSSSLSAAPNGALDWNDPLIVRLLQSLASQQQSVDQIQQQQLTQQVPSQFLLPSSSSNNLKPGDTMTIGGQQYVAVPLNSAAGSGGYGLMPAESSPAVNMPVNNQWPMGNTQQWNKEHAFAGSSDMSFNNAYGSAQQVSNFAANGMAANAAMPQQTIPMPSHQFHPGRRYSPPTSSYATEALPHEICRAHMADPFWWLSQH